ncbi:hypothetical protein R0K30_22605, partial [Bacillus sp. SIMBA_154]|uniref:hypothetical protein n=1 Tax=Bacillus sp. SIMBA_154 TaxID=3080859 RepID=UPI00397D99D1
MATSSRGSLPAGESSNRAPDRGASYVSPARMLRCERGDSWRVDGVTFTFLHPAAAAAALEADRNANSCVLRVAGR